MAEPSPVVLTALRVHPVKSVGGFTADSAVVEPWGLAGDRRWALIDESGKVVTQREQPRLAPAGAQPLPGGGVRLTAPGTAPLDVPVPGADSGADGEGHGPGDVVVNVFGTKVDARLAGPRAHIWFSAYLGAAVQLAHLADPVRARLIDPQYSRPGESVSLADGYPLHVITTASLDALNSLVAQGDSPEEGPLPIDRFRPNLVVSGTAPWAEDGWRRITVGEVTFRVAKPCGRCVITTTDQRTAVRGKEPLRTLGEHRRFGNRLVFGQNLIPENTGTVRVGDPVSAFTGLYIA